MPIRPQSVLDFEIDKTSSGYVGEGLQRPECILAGPAGTPWERPMRGAV
jgi:gluconolactonase